MFCLAGIGGRVSGIMKTTESAAAILAIDGCPMKCASQCLEQAGFKKYDRVQLAELGLEKGKSPLTDAAVEKVAVHGRQFLSKGCPA
jgi:uncharacterized metal-binding protein